MNAEKYAKLQISLRYWLIGKKYFKALEAMEFAAKYHCGTRADGITPEFSHQLSIAHFARTLSIENMEAVICAALLHDVVEDYDVEVKTIQDKFGDVVAHSVFLLSKQVSGVKKTNEEYYMSLRTDRVASIVKGCDRIHNHQTMPGVFSKVKQGKYIQETNDFILPMIKAAKRNFPDQEGAYENVKHVLNSQIQLLQLALIEQ